VHLVDFTIGTYFSTLSFLLILRLFCPLHTNDGTTTWNRTIWTCIREVKGSNPCRNIGFYNRGSSWFFLSVSKHTVDHCLYYAICISFQTIWNPNLMCYSIIRRYIQWNTDRILTQTTKKTTVWPQFFPPYT